MDTDERDDDGDDWLDGLLTELLVWTTLPPLAVGALLLLGLWLL